MMSYGIDVCLWQARSNRYVFYQRFSKLEPL